MTRQPAYIVTETSLRVAVHDSPMAQCDAAQDERDRRNGVTPWCERFAATLAAYEARMDAVMAAFPPRHTAGCASCARPSTTYGRHLVAQFHGWPRTAPQYPWNLLDADDVIRIENEARS